MGRNRKWDTKTGSHNLQNNTEDKPEPALDACVCMNVYVCNVCVSHTESSFSSMSVYASAVRTVPTACQSLRSAMKKGS